MSREDENEKTQVTEVENKSKGVEPSPSFSFDDSEKAHDFSNTLSTQEDVPSHTMASFLDAKSLGRLRNTNCSNQKIYEEMYYQALIKKNVGLKLQQLIFTGETAHKAYERHREVISGFRKIHTDQELSQGLAEMKNFPNYHPHIIIPEVDFVGVISMYAYLQIFAKEDFPDVAFLAVEYVLTNDKTFSHVIQNYDDLSLVVRNFPEHAPLVIGRVLTNNADFTRLIKNTTYLYFFLWYLGSNFPEYIPQTIERILTNNADFARLIQSTVDLHGFARDFPEYAPRAIERVLTNDADFVRIICNEYFLSNFAKKFPGYAPRAIERIFANDVDFARVIQNTNDLRDFSAHFPAYAKLAQEIFAAKIQSQFSSSGSVPENKQEEKSLDTSQCIHGQFVRFLSNPVGSTTTHVPEAEGGIENTMCPTVNK